MNQFTESVTSDPSGPAGRNLSISRPVTLRLAEPKGYDWPAMGGAPLYPRFAAPRLAEALTDSLVVLIHGLRRSGASFGDGFFALSIRYLWEPMS